MRVEALKVEVERIVHPLKAREGLKDLLREELWAHLLSLHNEALRASGHEDQALREALRRLGEPELLRTAFMDSLSGMGRWEGRFISALGRKPGHGPFRHAARLTAWLSVPPWLGLMVLLVATYPLPGMSAGTYALTIITCALAVLTPAVHAGALAAAARLGSAGGGATRRAVARFAGVILFAAGATFLAACGGHLLLTLVFGIQEQPELARVYRVFCTDFLVLLGASSSILTAASLRRLARRTRTPLHDWPYADAS